MVKCPSCGCKHRPGTVFCADCGVYLPGGGSPGTEPIPDRDWPGVRADGWQHDSGDAPAEGSPEALLLEILSTGRQIPLPSAGQVHIGRLDSTHDIFPDVDLTQDGGLEQGISRRHCKISVDEGRCFVEDLGSANGTFLNGERLTPYLRHRLNSEDELLLGRLSLKIVAET